MESNNMTQEEKAKAYDEALALAKRLISNNCTEVEKLCLECVLPELKESEDEKIRKALISYFEWVKERDCKSEWNGLKVDDIRAWLEKPKEQEEIPLMNGNADLYFDTWIQFNDTTKRGCFEEGIRYATRMQRE
jgi:hypothetical protein